MTRAVRLAACVLCALAPATRAGAQDATRVVITRPLIEAAGWFTLGEVLTGAVGWQRSTLDGVSFFANTDGLPAGAAAPAEPEWLVLIDGQRITIDALGTKLLDLLPLSPAQVESVTVTRVPQLAAGTIAGRGVVEFHTRRPPRGPAVGGAWHSGNVTGDPGPYGFTPLASQNVDRLGPFNHAFAGFGGAGWEIGAGAHQGSSHITHRGIRERFDPAVYDQLGESKWAPYDAVNAHLGGTQFGGRHDLFAGRGWVSGPLFLPFVGREQWLRGRVDHVGGSGTIVVGATTVGYQLAYTDVDMQELPSPFPFVAGHSRSRAGGVVDLGVSDERGRRARLGVGMSTWSVDRDGASARRTDATVFGGLSGAIGRFANELSGSLGRSSGGRAVAKGVLATRVSTDSLTTLSLALSYLQHATGDDGTWIDRTLLGLDTLIRNRNVRAWADLGVTRRMTPRWIADVGARAGSVSGVRLLSAVGLTLGDPVDGGVAELRAGLSRDVTARLPVARVTYRYATPLGGDAQLRDALRASPMHTLDAYLVGAVASDFRLGASVYVASSTDWAPLRGGPPAQVTLPAISRVDVSAEKWFWRHRVRTQVLLRNLFSAPERYHPLGADFPLRAHLTVGVNLPATR